MYHCSAEPYSIYGEGATFCGYSFLGGNFSRPNCIKCGAHADNVRVNRSEERGLHFACIMCKSLQEYTASLIEVAASQL